MSSTSRGAQRNPDDFYETPGWATRAVLSQFHWPAPVNMRPHVLEPMAGRGAIVREVRAKWPDAVITACELDPERARSLSDAGADKVIVGDVFQALLRAPFGTFDLCLGNPAFSLAMQTIELGLACAKQTTLLERLNYLGSQERAPFWRANRPDLLILPRRPSFAQSLKCKSKHGCKWRETRMLDEPTPKVCPLCLAAGVSKVTTDSVEYAWFSWGLSGGRWAIAELEAG